MKIAPKATTISNAKVFPVQISINAAGQKANPHDSSTQHPRRKPRERNYYPIGAVLQMK